MADDQNNVPPSKAEQVQAYIKDKQSELKGMDINTAGNPNYFVAKDVVFYQGNGNAARVAFAAPAAGEANPKDIVLPEGANRYVVDVYGNRSVDIKGNANRVFRYGATDEHYGQRLSVAGDNNVVTFDATSTHADVSVSGNHNYVHGTKGNDAVSIDQFVYKGTGNSHGGLNRIELGAGDDVVTQSTNGVNIDIPSYGNDEFYPAQYNTISGGAGVDTYRLESFLQKMDKSKYFESEEFSLVFNKAGAASLRNKDGAEVAGLAPDVERLEVEVRPNTTDADKGDTSIVPYGTTYRYDMAALREAFNKHNVRVDGAANPDIVPVTLRISQFGVNAAAGGYDDVEAKKIPRKY